MTKDEALTLALEALERLALPKNADDIFRRATVAIKEALAQPEQDDRRLQIAMRQWEDWKIYALELQKKLVKYEGGSPMILNTQPEQEPKTCALLYPQADYVATLDERPWVGLTDEDKDEIIRVTESDHYHDILMLAEAKLKEKNT